MERVSPPPANRRERRTESQPPPRPCVVKSLETRLENRKAFVGQKQKRSVKEKSADGNSAGENSVNADEVLYRDIEQIYYELSLPIKRMDMDPDRTPEKLQMKANLQAKIFSEIIRRETEALEKWNRANPGREFRGLRDPRWEHAGLVEQIHYWREHVAIASGTT